MIHIFFNRQLDFRSQSGSCLAILENGLETEITLPANTCLNDFSQSELSFGTNISMRNQVFHEKFLNFWPKSQSEASKTELLIKKMCIRGKNVAATVLDYKMD